MERIYENRSLEFILNAVNTGMIDFDDVKQISITSEKKPTVCIKMVEIDVSDFIMSEFSDTILKPQEISDFEPNCYDFIVFNVIEDDGKKILANMSLLEAITASKKAAENELDDVEWDITNTEWNLDLQ